MSWNIEIPKAEWFDHDSPGLDGLIREVCDTKRIAIDTETTGLNRWKDIPLFWSLSWGHRRITLHSRILPLFQKAFDDQYKYWYYANAKFDLHMLANFGCRMRGHAVDIQVMHALLHDDRSHKLKDIALEVKGWRWSDFKDTFRKRPGFTYQDALMATYQNDRTKLVEYAANDAYGTMQIGEELTKRLAVEPTWSLYPQFYRTLGDVFWKTEVPFTRVLWKMERKGIKVDLNYFDEISGPIKERMRAIEKEVAKIEGAAYSMTSPVDQAKALLERDGLKAINWSKGGKSGKRKPSLDEAFFMAHRLTNKTAALTYEFLGLKKIVSTFIDGIAKHVDSHDRIHSKFNQDTVRTGRLSSSDPGLQVIPNPENDETYQIRAAFVPDKGKVILSHDYKALEMRILACASEEPDMIKIFRDGWDIHMGNASMVFGVPYEHIAAAKKKKKDQLTDYDRQCLEYRREIKVVGFGLNYGMKEKLLAANLGSSVEHALTIIDRYMTKYPSVKRFFSEAVETARKTGYAYSIIGRRRNLPAIHSHIDYYRFQAERQASNMEIQGGASDIVRLGMLALDDAGVEERYGAELILQVHDELLHECPEETAEDASKEIGEIMEHALWSVLPVAFETDSHIAKNWYEAK